MLPAEKKENITYSGSLRGAIEEIGVTCQLGVADSGRLL